MKLKDWRQGKGLSQVDLAIDLGVSKATISRIESGDQRPSMDLAWRIHQLTRGKVRAQDFMEAAVGQRTTPRGEERLQVRRRG